MLLFKRVIDCGTYEHKDCHAGTSRSLTSIPSICKEPLVGLKRQSIWFAVVVLPLPVLPTNAILEPTDILLLLSLIT